MPVLPADWNALLAEQLAAPYYQALTEFIAGERSRGKVYPMDADIFNAFRYTPVANVKVVLLGQDPYHDEGQAHGLAFSVPPGMKTPPTLKNIFKELETDLGCAQPNHGCLQSWARQGVLLLNTVLTVRAHEAASHQGQGWEQFTDAVLEVISAQPNSCVFLLWGKHAEKKRPLIDATRHTILSAAHPSPLSAKTGFYKSCPFSQTNAALESYGRGSIDWAVTDLKG